MSYPAHRRNRTPARCECVASGGGVAAAGPFGRGTLGRQLVVRLTALVALAALLITTATALATRR